MSSILETIKSPADLRRLPISELPKLAEEIRQKIITVTSVNGGHLAPNLGAVELTIALHYAFDTPRDKIIWDVGHQCYAHKLLTGRYDDFDTLRQFNGISGFCSRNESEYDCFTTGHSSNSLSLALGMAKARDLAGKKNKVIAVIGDGALSGGMAFEALNNAGDMKTPLLVILNDNKMSINRNVGALNTHLARLRANPKYSKAKNDVRGALNKVPLIGKPVANGISGLKSRVKSILLMDKYFEDLGFTYLGPTDGHNIADLIEIFCHAAEIKKPVIIHTITTKGKGYAPAERSPQMWHGVSPFEIKSGETKSKCAFPSYTDIFGKELCCLAEKDPAIVAITAAMTDGTGLIDFKRRFPDRFFDVGIAEQHAVSFAAGLANDGMKPVFAVYSSFLQRAYDQVIEDVCLQKLPVIFAIDRAGIVGSDGCTHQGIFDLTYLRSIPNLTVMAPADTDELKMMLRFAIKQENPTAIRYPRGCGAPADRAHTDIEIGKAEILKDGDDLAIIAIGSSVATALEASELLKNDGIRATVVNARFAAPIDAAMLKLCSDQCHGRIVTIEENLLSGGFGEGCISILSGSKGRILPIGIDNSFVTHGEQLQLKEYLGIDPASVAAKIKEMWFK